MGPGGTIGPDSCLGAELQSLMDKVLVGGITHLQEVKMLLNGTLCQNKGSIRCFLLPSHLDSRQVFSQITEVRYVLKKLLSVSDLKSIPSRAALDSRAGAEVAQGSIGNTTRTQNIMKNAIR